MISLHLSIYICPSFLCLSCTEIFSFYRFREKILFFIHLSWDVWSSSIHLSWLDLLVQKYKFWRCRPHNTAFKRANACTVLGATKDFTYRHDLKYGPTYCARACVCIYIYMYIAMYIKHTHTHTYMLAPTHPHTHTHPQVKGNPSTYLMRMLPLVFTQVRWREKGL
jgi:hypothetical protein